MNDENLETKLAFCPFCKKQFFGVKELKVLFAICLENKSYRQIANEFEITEATVRSHVRVLKAKIKPHIDYFKKLFSTYKEFNLKNLFGGEDVDKV